MILIYMEGKFIDLSDLVNAYAMTSHLYFEIGDLLELNCTSEPSHPPSELSWEMNKMPVDEEENVIFRYGTGIDRDRLQYARYRTVR